MRRLIVLFAILTMSLTSSFAQSCDKIDSLIVVDTLGNLTILWNVNDTTLAYDYRFRLVGDTVWECFTTLDSFFVIDESDECIEYEVGISAVCPFDTSGYTVDTVISFCPSDTTNASPPDDASVLQIYPVPFNSTLSVTATGSELIIHKIIVRNLEGQVITSANGENAMNVNTSFWPEGVYFIEIETSDGHEVKKILKL